MSAVLSASRRNLVATGRLSAGRCCRHVRRRRRPLTGLLLARTWRPTPGRSRWRRTAAPALRGRLRDGAEVGEEPAPRLGQVDELLERGIEGLRVKRRELEPAYKHIGAAFGLLREEGVNFRGVGRGSAGYGSMAIRVDEQCPSTPTVVVQENLIGRAGGLEYLIVTAPVSLSLESS